MTTAIPTQEFRAEHAQLREHLAHVATWVGQLAAQHPAQQAGRMMQIVRFFTEHIAPHASWEESHLYPAVDRRERSAEPFTATMRHEHRIVERWIDELRRMSEQHEPDAIAFARRADNLLGLLAAHFEEEEEVLLPILDRSTTPAELAQELGALHVH